MIKLFEKFDLTTKFTYYYYLRIATKKDRNDATAVVAVEIVVAAIVS
jgi:hypothetical protein